MASLHVTFIYNFFVANPVALTLESNNASGIKPMSSEFLEHLGNEKIVRPYQERKMKNICIYTP